MNLTWHYPAYFDTDQRTTVEFATVEEFYALPRIVRLSAAPKQFTDEEFLRWSVSGILLMWEGKGGGHWVIAYLSSDAVTALNLPEWKHDQARVL